MKNCFLIAFMLISFNSYSIEFSVRDYRIANKEFTNNFFQSGKIESKKSSKQSFTNIVNIAGEKKDSNWWDWIPHTSFIFTILSFFFTFWYTRRIAKKNKRDSVNDLFWLREVIFPNVINHSLELVNSGPSKFRENDFDPEKFFRNYYLGMANTLRDRCIVATVISEEFKDDVESIIDDLDASIPEVEDEEGLKLLLSNFITEFFLKLKNEQFN